MLRMQANRIVNVRGQVICNRSVLFSSLSAHFIELVLHGIKRVFENPVPLRVHQQTLGRHLHRGEHREGRDRGGAEGGRALATSPRSPALYGGIERMISSAGVVSMESDSALCSWSRLVSAAQSFTQLRLPDHTTYIVQLHYITLYLQQPASQR